MIKSINLFSFLKRTQNTKKKKLNASNQNHIFVPHPNMINLCIKTICNSNCKMCYNWKPPANIIKPLDAVTWKKIITDLRRYFTGKNVALAFTGSESLLHPEIYELIKHAEDLKFEVWLHSNGSLINTTCVKKLNECGLKRVSLSLDSIIPEEHNLMRGKINSYDKVKNAIDFLYEKEIRTINITTVLCSYNYENIEKLIAWTEEHPKINTITLQAITQPFNTPPKLLWFEDPEYSHLWPKDFEKVEKVLNSIIKNKKKYTKLVNESSQIETYKKYFKSPLSFVNHVGCNVKSKHVCIGPDGNVTICPYEAPSGFLHRDSIDKIWESERHQTTYKNMKDCIKNCHLLINCAYEEE